MTNFVVVRISDNAVVGTFTDSAPYVGPLNILDTGLYLTMTAPNGVDPNGVVVQIDGQGNRSLVFDQNFLETSQRQQNKLALDSYITQRTVQAEDDIAAALQAGTGMVADDTTHLMIISVSQDIVMNPDAWTQSIQGDVLNGSQTINNLPRTNTIEIGSSVSGPNIPVGTVVSQIFTDTSLQMSNPATGDGSAQTMNFDPTPVAMADLDAYRPIFFQIQTIRNERDRDISNFIPPHPGVSPLYPA